MGFLLSEIFRTASLKEQLLLGRCCFNESCRAAVQTFSGFSSSFPNPFLATQYSLVNWMVQSLEHFSLSSNAQSRGVFFLFFVENLQFFGLTWAVFDFVGPVLGLGAILLETTPNFGSPKKPPGVFLKVSTLPCGECAQGLGASH